MRLTLAGMRRIPKRLGKAVTRGWPLFALGVVFGIGSAFLVARWSSGADGLLISFGGALGSVVVVALVQGASQAVRQYTELHPLRQVLSGGSGPHRVVMSPFYRDAQDASKFRLKRFDTLPRDERPLPLIIGTTFVYGRGDALALSFVLAAMQTAGRRAQVTNDWQVPDQWTGLTVCIGAHNGKTREVLEKTPKGLGFAANYRAIVRRPVANGVVDAVYPRALQDTRTIDYGILSKSKTEQFGTVIIVAGIGDEGTAGAAFYLSQKYADFENKEEFDMLVEVPSGYESAHLIAFDDVSEYLQIG